MTDKSMHHWRAALGETMYDRNITQFTGRRILQYIGTFKMPEEKEMLAEKATDCVAKGMSEQEIMKELGL